MKLESDLVRCPGSRANPFAPSIYQQIVVTSYLSATIVISAIIAGTELYWARNGSPVNPTSHSILYRGVLEAFVDLLVNLIITGCALSVVSRYARSNAPFWIALIGAIITLWFFVRPCPG